MAKPKALKISRDLSLPLDAVTSTFVILGIRGSGKSNTAVVMAEEMLKAKQQIVVLDPKDDWYGIRSRGPLGDDAGYPITIFGGRKADAPLEASAGAMIADLIVQDSLSCILSTRHFSDGQRFRFVFDFATRLYQTISEPLHLFIDEADQIAPQEKQVKIQKGDKVSEAMMLGLVRRLIKQGRTGGLGISLITQSPATLDKRVMNMCENLVAMRTVGAQDLAAVEKWVSAWSTSRDQHDETMARLPTFPTGTGLFWSPSFLQIYKILQFRPADTFDSRKTPKVGERRVEPKVLAPVDLQALTEKMKETIERAEQDDPKRLRLRIADLEAQLSGGQPQFETGLATERIAALETEVRELRTPLSEARQAVASWYARFEKLGQGARGFIDDVEDMREDFESRLRERILKFEVDHLSEVMPHEWDAKIESLAAASNAVRSGANDSRAVSARAAKKKPRTSAAGLLEATRNSGYPDVARSASRKSGATSAPAPAEVKDANEPARDQQPIGLGVFTKAEERALAGAATYPAGRSKLQLARLAHYHPDSRPFRDALPALEARGLIEREGDQYRPTKSGIAAAGARRAAIVFTKAEDAILKALAAWTPGGLTRARLALVAGYHQDSRPFRDAVTALQTIDLIEYRTREYFCGPEGRTLAGKVERPGELVPYWSALLDKASSLVLEALVDKYPNHLSKAALAEIADYHVDSRPFRDAFPRLKSLDLIEGDNPYVAAAALFEVKP